MAQPRPANIAAGVAAYDWRRLAQRQHQVYTALKILHVTKKYPNALGGDAVAVANLQKQQEAAGHQVAILSSNCDEIMRADNIYRFGLHDTPVSLDSITPRRLVSLVMLAFKSFWVLRQERPDVVHAHSVDMAFCISLAAHLYRIPVVHTFHIVTFYDQQQSVLRRKSELLLARGARLRAVTAPNQHDVARLRAAKLNQAVLLPNGVDLAFWRQTTEVRPSDQFEFLSVGRLEPQKGYEYLVKAVGLLAAASPQSFKVIIAGEGSQKAELVRLAKKLDVANRIDFVGRKSPEEVRTLLMRAGAAVFPSLYETTPLTLLEAWAAAVPVIATRVGILRDASLDTQSVFLVSPQSEHSLMQAMQLCMSDASLRMAIASSGYDDVQKYTWSRVAQTAEAIYGRVT
jgi:glycosyltransferase involved in cell wall biosynthesis